MKKKIGIPSKRFFNKAEKLVKSAIGAMPELYQDYYHVNDILTDDTPELQNLILRETGLEKFKISAGTSDMLAFKPYISQLIGDIQGNTYYRNYNNPLGNTNARQALAIAENAKFSKDIYTYKNVGLTEGSTGAISQIFEYIKREYPKSEVVIASPTYYLYKYLAKFYQLDYKEAFRIKPGRTAEFDSIKDIEEKISPRTKLIILVQPNNPTNQLSSISDLKALLVRCKKQKILLLVDELFSDLMYDESLFTPSDNIAEKVNALQNLVIVKGYSKSKNLAGFRIGYLFSANKNLMQCIDEISEQRQCFAGASNFAGVIILDSFIQTILTQVAKGVKVDMAIFKSKILFKNVGLPFNRNSSIKKVVKSYTAYKNNLIQKYGDYLDLVLETLGNDIESFVPKTTAFNTFVKIKGVEKTNFFDVCLNYYLCSNVVTQIGPCFAFDQENWQRSPNLGFWLRISYSRENKRKFIVSLKEFSEFKKIYLNNPDKYLRTNLVF